MNTLIIYATKHGSTGKCAAKLKEKLAGKVDVHNLKVGSAPDIGQYDRVIIGGSIYAGRIQKEVTEFCNKNLNTLKGKKVGLFICCMFDKNAETEIKSSFPQELLDIAVARDSFGGEMKFSEMSFAERTITKMVSKMDSSLGAVDMKKDLSRIYEENINKFAGVINNAS